MEGEDFTSDGEMNILAADMVGLKRIKFLLAAPSALEKDIVSVECDGAPSPDTETIEYFGGREGFINLSSPIDITKAYRLRIGEKRADILPITYFGSEEFNREYFYGGRLGAIADVGTSFKLWAPTASKAVLNVFSDGTKGEADFCVALTRGEKGVWSFDSEEDLSGKYYTYTVTTPFGESETVDPYAESVGLNGKRGLILPPEKGVERLKNPSFVNYTDAVIWEVHVRDFSARMAASEYKGKFLAFTERGLKNSFGLPVGVDYLKELGVTHVHLMPVFDFGGVDENSETDYNWGYNPENYNSPEGSYSLNPADGFSRVEEFKAAVNALHGAGIGVIMDVVFNHAFSLNSPLNKTVPYYYYRYNVDGTPSNGSGCGNETASERPMVRKYIIDSLTHWTTDYGVDGFRFDLMGLHDVTTMRAAEAAVHKINPQAIIYGEGWTGGFSTLPDEDKSVLANIRKVNADMQVNGVAMFNDVLRNGIKGSTDGFDTGFATGAKSENIEAIKFGVTGGAYNPDFSKIEGIWRSFNPTNVINYASAHDNLALWDKISGAYGEGEDTLSLRLRRNALAAAVVFTSLGVPFMQAGEEILRSKKNADGTYNANSYNAGDGVNAIRWEKISPESAEYKTFCYYKGLIALRKSSAALRAPSATENGRSVLTSIKEEGAFLAFTLSYGGEELFIIYNAEERAVRLALPQGTWSLFVDEDRAGADPVERGVSGEITVEKISCRVYMRE